MMPGNRDFHILMVCTGNTCRSPMAEGIARALAKEKEVNDLKFSSAGIMAGDGAPATDYAVAVAAHWNIDLSGHKSRHLTRKLIEQADLILAMAPEHVDRVIEIDRSAGSKTFLIKGFPQPFDRSQGMIDDPIGLGLEYYNQAFLELDEVLRRVFPSIIEISRSNV